MIDLKNKKPLRNSSNYTVGIDDEKDLDFLVIAVLSGESPNALIQLGYELDFVSNAGKMKSLQNEFCRVVKEAKDALCIKKEKCPKFKHKFY